MIYLFQNLIFLNIIDDAFVAHNCDTVMFSFTHDIVYNFLRIIFSHKSNRNVRQNKRGSLHLHVNF